MSVKAPEDYAKDVVGSIELAKSIKIERIAEAIQKAIDDHTDRIRSKIIGDRNISEIIAAARGYRDLVEDDRLDYHEKQEKIAGVLGDLVRAMDKFDSRQL